jgi:hypothetical protein
MSITRLCLLLASLASCVASAAAADLRGIERKIAKQPEYKTKPRYCLLVFGPEAKTRVWMVVDGDTLYVDRNGNGDLTEEGEKVAAKKADAFADKKDFDFEAGELRDGALAHQKLSLSVTSLDRVTASDPQAREALARDPQARAYTLQLAVEMPPWKGLGGGGRIEQYAARDVQGHLNFAGEPAAAPIVHFAGPWHVAPIRRQPMTIGREEEIILAVGTQGVGPGSTAWAGYDGVIPEKAHPKLEIVYPPAIAGEPPLTEHYELRGRC